MKTIKEKENYSEQNWLEIAEEVSLQSFSGHLKDTKKKKIAGVEVGYEKDTLRIQRAMKAVEEVHSIKERFNANGIPVIAVIQKNVFSSLISKLPFYTFKDINSEGKVKANVLEYVKQLDKRAIPSFLLLSALFFYGFWKISRFGGNAGIDGMVFFVMGVFYLIVVGIATLAGVEYSLSLKEITRGDVKDFFFSSYGLFLLFWPVPFLQLLNHPFLRLISNKTKKRLLFPKRCSAEGDPENLGEVQIDLPEAPDETKEVLIKLHNMGVKVYPVVHEGAFKVTVKDEELAYWRRILMDPVLVSESGDYIVVHTFYGEIPEEAKLVEKIRKTVSQVTEEYMNSVN